MKGSINAFGMSETSQCDTEEPGENTDGANMNGLPFASAPESSVGCPPTVTFAVARFAFSVLPSACEMPITGIVIVGSLPDIGSGGNPAALFTMITATAPAACAAAAFGAKLQLPRSISAILPAIAPAFVIA